MKETKYKIVKTLKEVHRLVKHCKTTGYASLDFETKACGPQGHAIGKNKKPTGYAYKEDEPNVLGISFQIGSAWIVPLFHAESPFTRVESLKALHILSAGILEDEEIVKIAQNMKFEDTWLKRYNCQLRGRLFDIMLAKYLLNEERPHGLKDMVTHYIPELSGYEDEIRKLVSQYKGWEFVPLEPLCKYNAEDCDVTLQIYLCLEKKLIKQGFYKLFRNLLMMAHRVLTESEFEGILVDREYLEKIILDQGKEIEKNHIKLLNHKKVRKYDKWRMKNHIKVLIKACKVEIKEIKKDSDRDQVSKIRLISAREEKVSRYIAGELTTNKEKIEDVNFGSPKQMLELLYEAKGGFSFDIPKYTDTGNPSTDEESLLILKPEDKSGFLDQLLKHRELTKLYSTYMIGINNRLNYNSRIHGSFLIHGTVTGRLSSREPNLQNIPRATTSNLIKPMFICPPGYKILQLDYSQAELRVMAEMANETEMIRWFKEGRDIHLATACHKLGWDYDERLIMLNNEDHKKNKEVKIERKKAKTTNFGIAYEQSAAKLAAKMTEHGVDTSKEEAEDILNDWFERFPRVKKFINRQHRLVKKQGYVYNLFGRKRRLPNIHSDSYGIMLEAERQSVNAPVQGTASDFALFSSILIREEKIKNNLPWDMPQIFTVHDSLGYYIRPKEIHAAVPILEKICADPDTMKWFGFKMKRVNMKVDFEIGDNWADLKSYNPEIDY